MGLSLITFVAPPAGDYPIKVMTTANYIYVLCESQNIYAYTFDGANYTQRGVLTGATYGDLYVKSDSEIAVTTTGTRYLRTYSFDGTSFNLVASSVADAARSKCSYSPSGAHDITTTAAPTRFFRTWDAALAVRTTAPLVGYPQYVGSFSVDSAQDNDFSFVSTNSGLDALVSSTPSYIISYVPSGAGTFNGSHDVRYYGSGLLGYAWRNSIGSTFYDLLSFNGSVFTFLSRIQLVAPYPTGYILSSWYDGTNFYLVADPDYGTYDGGLFAFTYSGGVGGTWTLVDHSADVPVGGYSWDGSVATQNGYIHVADYSCLKAYELSSPPPVADFSGTPTSSIIPVPVQFTDLSTNSPTSWLWTFGDGVTGADQNPLHDYTLAGLYTVSLEATNLGGSDTETKAGYIDARSHELTINADVLVGIVPFTVNFTVTVLSGSWLSFTWNFGDGQSAVGSQVSHTYTTVGYHTVALVGVKYNAEIETVIERAWIRVGKLSFEVSQTSLDDIPQSVSFSNTCSAPTGYEFHDWQWDFGDASLGSGLTGPSHIYGEYGNYNVRLDAKMKKL
jgi:PKD repeat protein